jgi:hypothetical protein
MANDIFSGERFLEYLARFEIDPSTVTRFDDFAVIGYQVGKPDLTIYSFCPPTEASNAKAAFFTNGRVCTAEGDYFPTGYYTR